MNIDAKYIHTSVTPKQKSDTQRDIHIIILLHARLRSPPSREKLTQLQLASAAKGKKPQQYHLST